MSSPSSPVLARISSGRAVVEGLLEIPPNPAGVVLFAHGSGSSRHSPRNNYVAGVLRKAGTGTLLMDLLTPTEDEDTAARFDIGLLTERLVDAVGWLRNLPSAGKLPLGLFGASTGAGAALEAAAILGPEIGAVVSRGGRPDLARPRSLSQVSAPTLFLVGALDTDVIEMNRQAFERLRCEKKMILVPGATHLFEEPGTLEQVATLAAEWFTGHFSRPAEGRPRPHHP